MVLKVIDADQFHIWHAGPDNTEELSARLLRHGPMGDSNYGFKWIGVFSIFPLYQVS